MNVVHVTHNISSLSYTTTYIMRFISHTCSMYITCIASTYEVDKYISKWHVS